MTKVRQLWLLTALASIAALAGGYFMLVSPKNAKAEALREETATQEQQNESLRTQIQMLNRQKKDLPRQQAELERFAVKIPNNPALPTLIRSLSDSADTAGVFLDELAPSMPAVVGPATPVGAVSADPAAAPATAAAPAPTVSTLPLATMPVTVKATGRYSEMSQFLSEIERLPRAFLVSGVSMKPKPGENGQVYSGEVEVTITGQLYMTIKAPAAPRPQPAATTVVK